MLINGLHVQGKVTLLIRNGVTLNRDAEPEELKEGDKILVNGKVSYVMSLDNKTPKPGAHLDRRWNSDRIS